MAASRTGRVDAVKLLLSSGSFVNAADPFQEETALMWASAEGHVEVVKALLAAGADPNLKAHVSTITERKDADHPSGGFTALMFAARNGHADVVEALIQGRADPKLTNADGASAAVVAIVNDRFDLAKELLDLGADPNDGSLFFAVDMHDGTTDMRAHDGSRLQPTHPNNLTALGLVKVLLDLGADVNKPFIGALHSTTLCCGATINSSPFYRAASAADVEVLKLMLAHGAQIEWSPSEIKPKDGKPAAPGRPNPNIGKTPVMAVLKGGAGASIAAGPGFNRLVAPPFREPGSRDPLEALNMLLAAGANPNAKAPDGSTPLHLAAQEQQVPMIRALVAAGGKLDAVNKDNLTPLLLVEKPKKPDPADMGMDPDAYHPKRNSKEEVVAALRELMHLGPNDPAPQPPPLPPAADKDKKDDKEQKKSSDVATVTKAQ
jgi:ankyrin repeat protein